MKVAKKKKKFQRACHEIALGLGNGKGEQFENDSNFDHSCFKLATCLSGDLNGELTGENQKALVFDFLLVNGMPPTQKFFFFHVASERGLFKGVFEVVFQWWRENFMFCAKATGMSDPNDFKSLRGQGAYF